MKSKTKVRDRVRDETEKIRKTTKKLNSKIMEKVKIKRVKRNKKKATTGEKVLAAVGLGSTLLGGAGAVSSQPKATQFVRTQTNEKGSKTQGIKDRLREIFGINQAKAAGSVDAAQTALTAAENALSDFDAWVSSATADVPKFAPEDQAQRQNDIDAEVARTRPGLEQAVADAQAAYNQAVADAQGPQEGDTKNEGGVNYTFYQGSWVINNGQTKNEGGFSYGSEGGQWILLDGQTKNENGKTYISSGGQWVEKPADVQAPQIGETKTGTDGYQYVFSSSIYSTGAWTLVDGQTKTENGKVFVVQGGTWVEQQTSQPKEGDTKTENGRSYHFSGGQWVDNAGNRVQNPNTFWYIADGNGGWTLEDGQTKTENGKTYTSTGGEWVEQQDAGQQATGAKEGDTRANAQGQIEAFHNGQWGQPYINDSFTDDSGIQYFNIGSASGEAVWVPVVGQEKVGDDGKTYVADGHGAWTLKVVQQGTQNPAVAPTVTFTTNSGNTTTPKVGDTWSITITGPAGAPVFSTANGSTTQMGVIGADGKLVLTGTFQAGDVGTWNQQWTVGEGASQLQAGNVDFQLTASQSNQVQQTVPFGQETLSFTVKDNGNGTFSIIYNGSVLVTGSSKADVDAARAKFPFMYATPEAIVLSTVSNGFNNYFVTTGSQIKLDNGTRTTVSTTENREVFRDSSGNAAAYFNEFGGRIYYNKTTGDLYREDKDGNYVKMDLSEISPQTRQNIINALTGTGSNIKVTTVTHNLLSELGQPVKGPNLKQDPKDGNWYVTDDKGNYVLDANGSRIQANLQRFVWSPGGWSSWGYNVEGLNEEMAKYSSKEYTVDVVTAPNGAKSYTLTVTLPDGKPASRTFLNATEFNNFLATNFTTSNAFMDMSPADKAIFMAATDARIHFPELTAAFIGSTPAASTNHRVIWRNPNNGMLEVQGLINPTYMSTYQQAQSLQSLFPGSQIKERLPLSWPGVMAYEYDPADPRRVFEVILSDGTVLNVSNAMNSIKQDGQTLTVQGFPQNVVNQIKPPTGTKVNALFVGGVDYGSAADNANAANGLVEPGSFGPSANPTYSGAIVPFQWLNLGNGQGGIVDPASPYTTNKQNGLNPNQGVVDTGVKPTTTTTNTNTLLNNLFTLPINTGSGSGSTGTGGSAGGNTGGTGAGVGTGTQQAAPMPSITKVSSQKLKPGDTIQITGQNITQGTTLAELVNQKGNVVGLTVVSSTSGSMTAKLPQYGLESGQYTIQLRFVGTGANFGKVSSGFPVSVESTTPAGATGAQTGTQSATGQTAQLAAPISVGEDLGKNPANGKSVFLTHLAVYTQDNVNTSGKVAPGSVIELGGQGLSAFNKYS
ncbi:MAG: hypothetical protein M1333_02750, partial [Patescibacteria group bacterium]|nr:hypothetical protein [Patescibacteria group bacterium]